MDLKFLLYGVMVACFLIAGTIDIVQGHAKPGVISIGFGVMNALIFFWR